jgi:hypothetical protein
MEPSMPLLIAVSGKLGSGKDYVADLIKRYLVDQLVVSKMAFADHIKINVVSQEKDIDIMDCLEGDKSTELRRKLQVAGTEKGRSIYGSDIWIRTIENWIKLRRLRDDGVPHVVIVPDCRFPNEADWICEHRGLLIRIDAPTRTEQALQQESDGNIGAYLAIKNHVSETMLDDYVFEYRINNDAVEHGPSVTDQIEQILRKYLSCHLDFCGKFGNISHTVRRNTSHV